MNPASRALILLLLVAVLVLCAGCSVQQSAPATGVVPAEQNELARYALAREDIPFTVMTEKKGVLSTPAATDPKNPYGIILVYDISYYQGKGESQVEKNVQQIIYRFPEKNASLALADFRETIVLSSNPANTKTRVVMDPTIAVGNQTVVFYSRPLDSSSPEFSDSVVAFTKGNILEIISLSSRDHDLDTAETLAKKAASWVPNGRILGPATPVITGGGGTGLDAEYPFRATALSTNRVGKLAKTLTSGAGSLPLGAGKTRFWVYLPSGGGDTYFTTGEKTVTITWKKTVGQENEILEPGETALVELDFAAADFAQDPATINHGMGIMVTGPSGSTTFSCGNLPATLVPGSTYDCW